MLLNSTPGRKAGALAVSLTAQALAAGTLLLIPLVYTDRLPFVPLTLPIFLSPPPPPPPELPKAEPARSSRMPVAGGRIFVPIHISRLDTRPDVAELFGDAPQIDSTFGPSVPGGLTTTLFPLSHMAPPPPVPIVESAPAKPITVTSDMQAAKLLRKVVPIYPRLAIVARVSGTVRLIGTVGKDGMLQQIQVVSGPALLVQSAVDAVRQWVYRPTILNGKPVEVIAPIEVNFTLSQ